MYKYMVFVCPHTVNADHYTVYGSKLLSIVGYFIKYFTWFIYLVFLVLVSSFKHYLEVTICYFKVKQYEGNMNIIYYVFKFFG